MLTGGGDCPGLTAWRGVLEHRARPLTPADVEGLLPVGGTVLGTSRTNPYADEAGEARVLEVLAAEGVEALVAIGGEDTLGVAARLSAVHPLVVGVPKTIDNDLDGTEVTFGFHTAVQTATEAIDRLRTTAESHHRVIVCEVMGRHAGWIATYAGVAGGAAEVLVPERPFDVDAVCDRLERRHRRGRYSSVVVVSEGALPGPDAQAEAARVATATGVVDQFGHAQLGGIGAWLAGEIEARTGFESRVTTLGHVQRGGTPTAYDRVLATRFGVAAVAAVHAGHGGVMVALDAGRIVEVPLAAAAGPARTLDLSLLDEVAGPFLG